MTGGGKIRSKSAKKPGSSSVPVMPPAVQVGRKHDGLSAPCDLPQPHRRNAPGIIADQLMVISHAQRARLLSS